ncbi:MAG: DUF4905 domain-containing protein [Ignavibacteriaceae bacterium]|nr:DUF4905 domain-containing protein [Ignavibacterium sp.]MCC6254023.1 DUF4905 domain-containing protein [Ignavibacteriaceae bacterium]HRN25074.1 DUF4905 domain-containing protein [Ignavibacteriaceae bacterium]HRP91769.1 DUF4905 domain-containing protein [Ignavibacteriaceae bacterium]HRQ52895.1 DUF4905 domain-containing protein [Ignavibacteriaceae bacterium]
MKLKKQYKHDNKKQIWRILPTANQKLVIEERDASTKEVFFNCLEIESGKKIFKNFQLDEKNWIGIESIFNDIIFFHAYGKPDMPAHKSIIAFDIKSQTILWQNDSYVFSFVFEDKVYCYQQRFESRVFFALDYLTGNVIEDFGSDVTIVNELKEKSEKEFYEQNYFFPEYFNRNSSVENEWQKYLSNALTENVIKGEISYLRFKDFLLFNYHEVSKSNTLNNIFTVVDLSKNKIILKEILDKSLSSLMPESFFVKDKFLFLIVDKTKVLIYKIME